MRIAFIGLGNMGAAMAACILKAGHDLTVWNRSLDKALPLAAQGAKLAPSAAAAARDADLVITCLMDDASELDLVHGSLLAAMRPGAVHLCTTTISPACADRLSEIHAQAGQLYVSGVIIGRPDAAAAGRLATYLSGPHSAIETVKPVCETYAEFVVEMSERPSIANCMKLIVNYAGASIIEIIGETYAFAEKSGVDLAFVQRFFQLSFAHPALRMYTEKVRKRDYKDDVGFAMSAGFKDIRLMLAAADEVGVAFEIGRVIERKMQVALSGDLAAADWSATCEVTRRESGLG